jgi:hypothetical protein
MKTIAIFLVVAAAVYAFFGRAVFPQWKDYERLVHSGSKIRGKVVAKEPENHQSIRYEYSVDSKIYSGSSSTGFGGLPLLSEIKIGDQIPVTYWPERPSVSLPGDPADLYSSWSLLLFVVLPCVSLLVGGIAAFLMRRRSPKSRFAN